MDAHHSTTRFSDRVASYVKYRPGYPQEVYTHLREHAGLAPSHQIADLGSGTGLLSRLFLSAGHRVFGIEPNPDMRRAAETEFAGESLFTSLEGRAEAIPLPDHCVDMVVAGQAFHWFDPALTQAEAARILRPPGHAALIWNNWEKEFSPFLQSYGELLEEFGTDYQQVRRQNKNAEEGIASFFSPRRPLVARFPNVQLFDWEGLRGRLLSSSYTPLPGDPRHEAMLARLEEIFTAHQQDGRVRFEYQTVVYHAPLEA